jgi:hypothetical protein
MDSGSGASPNTPSGSMDSQAPSSSSGSTTSPR